MSQQGERRGVYGMVGERTRKHVSKAGNELTKTDTGWGPEFGKGMEAVGMQSFRLGVQVHHWSCQLRRIRSQSLLVAR